MFLGIEATIIINNLTSPCLKYPEFSSFSFLKGEHHLSLAWRSREGEKKVPRVRRLCILCFIEGVHDFCKISRKYITKTHHDFTMKLK